MSNIWKDPMIELPRQLARVVVQYEYEGLDWIKSPVQFSNIHRQEFVDLGTSLCLNLTGKVLKWCYEEDLLKELEDE